MTRFASNSMRATGKRPRFDVAIVGAGPAGLAAAGAAAAQGASVVVIDAAEQPGGQYWRHRSEAAGIVDDGALHHGWPEYVQLRATFDRGIERGIERDVECGIDRGAESGIKSGIGAGAIRYLPSTSVWMVSRTAAQSNDEFAPANTGFVLRLAPAHAATHAAALASAHADPPAAAHESLATIHATRLVLATGGYDRQLPVPGWDLPGVMAAGGIQAFVKQNGMLPSKRFVIGGTGPFLLPVAANIVQSGGSVAAVCESSNLGGWLPRAHRAALVPSKGIEGAGYVAAFLKHRVPYRRSTVITEILGDDRVQAVRTIRVRRDGSKILGSEREIDGIDGVGLGWGFTPQLELPMQLGVSTRQDADGSLVCVVDTALRAEGVPGLFVAGELSGVGGAALAVLEGRVAGRIAAAEAVAETAGLHASQTPATTATAVPSRPASNTPAQSTLAPSTLAPSALVPSTAELRGMRHQRNFANAMHLAHPVPAGWQGWLRNDTVVCRCEEVSAGELFAARDTMAADELRTQKGLTRAGMGWCQGRVCGFASACIAGGPLTTAPAEASLAQSAKRPIAQPLPLGQLGELDG